MHSGSKITKKQYLLLRVLWSVNHFDPEKLDLGETYNDARQLLGQFSPFLNYLDSVKNAQPIAPFQKHDTTDLGIFNLPRHYQLEVEGVDENDDSQKVVITPTTSLAQTPALQTLTGLSTSALDTRRGERRIETLMSNLSHPRALAVTTEQDVDDIMMDTGQDPKSMIQSTSSLSAISPAVNTDGIRFPPTVGEQIVNHALVLFLQALSMKFPLIKSTWTPYLLSLTAKFATASFVA